MNSRIAHSNQAVKDDPRSRDDGGAPLQLLRRGLRHEFVLLLIAVGLDKLAYSYFEFEVRSSTTPCHLGCRTRLLRTLLPQLSGERSFIENSFPNEDVVGGTRPFSTPVLPICAVRMTCSPFTALRDSANPAATPAHRLCRRATQAWTAHLHHRLASAHTRAQLAPSQPASGRHGGHVGERGRVCGTTRVALRAGGVPHAFVA